MKLQVFQHVSFEGSAYIEEIAESNSYDISVCRFDKREIPASPLDYDMLIVMGGPMSIYEETKFPWLTSEKKAIELALEKNKLIFGFCLGAQLIADVLGAKVFKNKEKEIGWYPVSRVEPGVGNPTLQFLPDIATVFHWHGETFDLPGNAVRIYSSEATENQAFLYGSNVLAMQFHLETLKPSIEDLLRFCKSDLSPGKYVMSQEQMLDDYRKYETSNKKMLRNLFRYFVKGEDV
jgi:GMP synthase-like glutamine amidotransferase